MDSDKIVSTLLSFFTKVASQQRKPHVRPSFQDMACGRLLIDYFSDQPATEKSIRYVLDKESAIASWLKSGDEKKIIATLQIISALHNAAT